MKIEEMLAELESRRAVLHRYVDERMDQLAQKIKDGKPLSETPKILPLASTPHHFKGKKPLAVIFPDGQRVEVKTWKALAAAILRDCIASPLLEKRMLSLRGKIMGKQRVLLGGSPKGMDAPLEISQDLYMEGKFDTESLLYVLTKRILDPVGYQYQDIFIQLR